MNGSYSPELVAFCVLVAIGASSAARNYARSAVANDMRTGKSWAALTAGLFSMGIGLWSVQFIGMLVLQRAPAPVFHLPVALSSIAVAMLLSGVALLVMRRAALGFFNLLIAAMLIGVGGAVLHDAGASGMPVPIHAAPAIFLSCVLIGLGESLAALWEGHRLGRKRGRRLAPGPAPTSSVPVPSAKAAPAWLPRHSQPLAPAWPRSMAASKIRPSRVSPARSRF